MATKKYILSIDQGTTSSRAIAFDEDGQPAFVAQQEFPQIFPNDGWVEHDPEAIWVSVLAVSRAVVRDITRAEGEIAAIGITNQRETTVVWDRTSGRPIYNAVVWQDRRTARACRDLIAEGRGAEVSARTGLVIDPYFSATKVRWILDSVLGAQARAEAEELAFGTIDSFLLWRLTGGRVHATDATNASRTNLYNIHDNAWDPWLLDAFGVPDRLLPEVKDSAADFGTTDPELFGRAIPIRGVAGDQQAAAIGQICFQPGAIKNTYGTGAFVVLNTGETPLGSRNRLLTTICYRLGGRTTYALEGSIFVCGAAVQWLRDGLGVIRSAAETEFLARGLDGNHGVYMVPAFTGLGAPHWDPQARGAIFGITRDTSPAHLVRAALESVCYQTRDLLDAIADDGVPATEIRVDGGMVANTWMLQFLANVLGIPVDRPAVNETTALGAACLAGLASGLFSSLDEIAAWWRREARLTPAMGDADRAHLIAGWKRAVARIRGW